MRWNERTSAHTTGSATITNTTMTVGDTSAMPARESRRARVLRARRPLTACAWISTSVATGSGLSEPGLDLLDRGLDVLGRLGRVLAADHVGDRAGDRLLSAQGADERSLALGEAPALEVLDAFAERLDRLLGVEL